jgi:hypothetical protein
MNRFLLALLMIVSFSVCSCQRNEDSKIGVQEDVILANGEAANSSNIFATGKSANEAFEMLQVVFKGNPRIEFVERLLSAVMEKYHLEINYENINRCGSAVLSLREASAVGVTEMEILKHMYQQGDKNQSFPNQAGVSAAILEVYK